jgi:PAS domain S-box-containing protein
MSDESALARALAQLEELRAEVRRLNEEGEQTRRFLEQVRDALPYVVYLFDVRRLRTLYLNRHMARELGYDDVQAAALGERFLEHLLHPEDFARLPELLARWEDVRDGEVLTTEHRLRHASGEWRWYVGRDTVFARDADGRVTQILGTSIDVTATRDLERRLAHGQRLEALGRFAGGIAHDFNNVLTAVLGCAEMARDRLEHGLSPREEIDEIAAAGRQAAALTRQLLAFARQQVQTPELFQANDVIRETVRMLSRLIGSDVTVTLSLAPDAGALRADRSQLSQVLLNLVLNARDAMPRGGRLAIETQAVRLESGCAERQPDTAPGDYVRIRVEDEGVGMTREVRERAFEPLFTTKPGGAGTGLGLAIVQGVVLQAGGQIAVASEPGRGTRFDVYLPRASAGEAEPAARPALPGDAALRDRAVLVVEDEPAVGDIVREALARAGARVTLTRTPEQALAAAAGLGASLELVVSDVVLPGLSGPELLQRLRARLPGLRALLISGYAPTGLGDGSAAVAGTAFLQKPFAPRALVERALELLAEPPPDASR